MPRYTIVYKPSKEGVFDESNPYHMVSLITGPSHALICVKIAEPDVELGEVKVTPLIANEQIRPSGIEESELRAAVLSGAEKANRECGVEYRFKEIQYPIDDSPRYELFERCGYLLVRRLAENGEFRDERFDPR